MLLSVFTPTHNPTWLLPAYNSLKAQTYQNYEWVLVLNGELRPEQLPREIREDQKVKVYRTDGPNIGKLKNFACGKCNGAIFVEFDHDDQLLPSCLQELVNAVHQTPNGFYFSDFLHLKEDDSAEIFDKNFGWNYSAVTWNDKEYQGMQAFPANARSICEVYWAPNHVRAWSREAYARAGGHDVNLEVADDHDLLCRTYLAQVPFVHIPKILYVYRVHHNTVVEKNKKIQILQTKNRDTYLLPLIKEEARRKGKSLIDVSPNYAVIKDENFEKQPFLESKTYLSCLPDNSVGCFRAYELLQLLPSEQHVNFMNLLYDKLIPGGWLLTSVPSLDDGKGKVGRGAFQDPRHKSYWSLNNWDYFTKKDFMQLLPGLEARFQIVRQWVYYPSKWHEANFIPYLSVDLCAVKDEPIPGAVWCQ